MPDFNQATPPETLTNPESSTPKGAPYPKVLYKAGEGKHSMVVAWDGDKPIHNQIIDVTSESEEAKRVAEGWKPKPVIK